LEDIVVVLVLVLILVLLVVVIVTHRPINAAERVPGTRWIATPQTNSRRRGEIKNPQHLDHYFSQSFLGPEKVKRLVLHTVCSFQEI
jgi:hypothetical protein